MVLWSLDLLARVGLTGLDPAQVAAGLKFLGVFVVVYGLTAWSMCLAAERTRLERGGPPRGAHDRHR